MKAKVAKKEAKAAEPKEITREIKGQLAFQRIGQGMATFKIVSPNILNNPLVQVPADVLPADYSPDNYAVSGTFLYTITVRIK